MSGEAKITLQDGSTQRGWHNGHGSSGGINLETQHRPDDGVDSETAVRCDDGVDVEMHLCGDGVDPAAKSMPRRYFDLAAVLI
jgi:hypothetical protein